jgi:hypothetical protein
MRSVETAYSLIGEALASQANPGWIKVIFHTFILKNYCSSMSFLAEYPDGKTSSFGLGRLKGFEVSDTCIFLRDDLLATTGDRIWGLTYTLFTDGKIKIEYDYNKPADYEETDEVITGEEMNQSLTDLFPKK